MKKLLVTVFSAFLFLSGISYVDAKATFNPVEENSKASLNLNFDTGYVGGIELKAKVSGDVTVTGIDFNSSYKDYTKRYTYDKNSKILTIYITTGSNAKNLLDENRNMNIGSLNVTSTKSNEKYSLELQSLSIIEANYASKVENDIHTTQNSFTFNKKETSNSNSNSNSNHTSNSTNSNSNKNTNSNSQVSNSNTNSNTSSNTNSNLDNSNNDDSNSNSSVNSSSNKTEDKNEDKKEEEKTSFPFIYILLGIGVLAIVGIIAFIIKKNRD